MKPQTFMNLSGNAIAPYVRREGWSAATGWLVIIDEVALPLGTHRFRAKGSAGGHNGLKSIEAHVGSQDYARLRIGIKPGDDRPVGDLSDFVLGKAGKAEREAVTEQLPALVTLVEGWVLGLRPN